MLWLLEDLKKRAASQNMKQPLDYLQGLKPLKAQKITDFKDGRQMFFQILFEQNTELCSDFSIGLWKWKCTANIVNAWFGTQYLNYISLSPYCPFSGSQIMQPLDIRLVTAVKSAVSSRQISLHDLKNQMQTLAPKLLLSSEQALAINILCVKGSAKKNKLRERNAQQNMITSS